MICKRYSMIAISISSIIFDIINICQSEETVIYKKKIRERSIIEGRGCEGRIMHDNSARTRREVVEDDRITIRQPEGLLTRKSLKSLEYHAKLSHLIVDRLSSFADVQVKCLLMIYIFIVI